MTVRIDNRILSFLLILWMVTGCTRGVAVFGQGSDSASVTDDFAALDTSENVQDAPALPDDTLMFDDVNGLLVVEAEHFDRQDNVQDGHARWFIQRVGVTTIVTNCVTNTPCTDDTWPFCNAFSECDGDDHPPDLASAGAYVESLPDRLRDGGQSGLRNLGRAREDGGAVLNYTVRVSTAGRYYVWVRGYATAGNDDVMYVGLNGTWPPHPTSTTDNAMLVQIQRKNEWHWSQRFKESSRSAPESTAPDDNLLLDIAEPGTQTIQFGMRDDGFEFDRFILTRDPSFVPDGLGPAETRQR